MNFSPDAPLVDTPPSRREEPQPPRVHYTNEFSIYQKARENGHGFTKRARCNHCQGDWAYNETRLKHHITNPYRGCRRIPPEARERVRVASEAGTTPAVANSAAATTAAIAAGSSSPNPPLPKRKREQSIAVSAAPPIQSQGGVVPVSSDDGMPVAIAGTPETQSAHVRVAVEFSMSSGISLTSG